MPSIYVKCEQCGATYMGEPHHPKGLMWGQGGILESEAKAIGWTGSFTSTSSDEKCPACSGAGPKQGNADRP